MRCDADVAAVPPLVVQQLLQCVVVAAFRALSWRLQRHRCNPQHSPCDCQCAMPMLMWPHAPATCSAIAAHQYAGDSIWSTGEACRVRLAARFGLLYSYAGMGFPDRIRDRDKDRVRVSNRVKIRIRARVSSSRHGVQGQSREEHRLICAACRCIMDTAREVNSEVSAACGAP